MKKNILIFSSKQNESHAFCSILNGLYSDYCFILFGTSGSFYNFFKEKNWTSKKFYLFRNILILNKFQLYLFFCLKPLLKIFYFILLLFLKYRKRYHAIFLINFNEKLIISPLARFLKIKVFWIETDDINYFKLNNKLLKQFKNQARLSKIICLNKIFKYKLTNLGLNEKKISVINPRIKKSHNKYQENIFSKIAKSENNQIGKKFFTIGTITDLNDKAKIETLFTAFKNSMSVVPRMQLILVGNGELSPDNNPWVKWLAKKMEIDTMVWFVTDTSNIKKWLDSFDVFVLSSRILNLDDFKTCLYAMESELAPIVPAEIGYEDLISNAKNGFFYELNNSMTLTEIIINYYKNRRLRIDLGRNAKEEIDNNFQIIKTLEEFKNII